MGYDSELIQIFDSVVDSTTRLLRLSITIRNPAPHDRFLRAKATSAKHNEPWDVQHARDKFPQADPELAERLGKALSQRRQYFKYRESHHGRLAHGLVQTGKDEEPGGFDDDHDAKTQTVFSTLASSLPLHLRSPADDRPEKELEPAVLDEDQTSETGVSQTSFATSTSTPNILRIPQLPKKASDGPFECQFCYMIISAPNSRAWKRHVHADLQPYICLWKDCSTPHQQFQRRSHWLNHILQYHWRSWYCSLGCSHEFLEREGIRSHILDAHSEAALSTSLETLSSLGEKPRPLNQEVMCPLCHVELRSITEYAKHVGKHLVDIALFALPSGKVDDEEKNDEEMPESNSNSDSDSDHESLGHIEAYRNISEESARAFYFSKPESAPLDDAARFPVNTDNLVPSSQEFADAQQTNVRTPAENDLMIKDSGVCNLPSGGIRLHKVAQVAGEQIIAQPHMCPEGNECDRFQDLKTFVALINHREDQDGMKLDVEEVCKRIRLLCQLDSAPPGGFGPDANQLRFKGNTKTHRSHTLLDMSKTQLISLVSYTGDHPNPCLEFKTVQRIWLPGSRPILIGRYNTRTQPSNDPLIQDHIGFKSKVISRKHCEVLIQDGRWYIRDLGSSSGTFLNHIRMSAQNKTSNLLALHSGDLVQLGINFKAKEEEVIFRCVRMKIFYETVEESFTTEDVMSRFTSRSHLDQAAGRRT